MSVYAKLLEAQKAISGIEKTGHNNHFNYDFFEEREVLKVARAALNDAGLAFFYSVESVNDREVTTGRGRQELLTDVFMRCTIYDGESGESVEGCAIGRGQDGQDKGINKAIVAGLKYWLLKTLMIPTGDDTESDAHTTPEGNVPRPVATEAEIDALAAQLDGMLGTIPNGELPAVRSLIENRNPARLRAAIDHYTPSEDEAAA